MRPGAVLNHELEVLQQKQAAGSVTSHIIAEGCLGLAAPRLIANPGCSQLDLWRRATLGDDGTGCTSNVRNKCEVLDSLPPDLRRRS